MIEIRVVMSIASLNILRLGLKSFQPSKVACMIIHSANLKLIYHYSITSDIERLIERKCHPPSKKHESWLVDPLKFVVDLPSHRDVIYVAVISQVEDVFVLHEVYQKQPKQLNSTFDIVLPQRYAYLNVCSHNNMKWHTWLCYFRKYDIRVGDCCALMVEAEDDTVRQIAERITRSIHK